MLRPSWYVFICEFALLALLTDGRGCLLETATIKMANGTDVQIRHVQPGNRVLSWSEAARKLTTATVIGKEVLKATDLMRLSFVTSDGLYQTPIVMTIDHPVWSERLQGLVSMAPEQTLISYGLDVSEIGSSEVLHHHSGANRSVHVSRFFAKLQVTVMTLQLEQHHWFFAHGVRVHNKARSSGMHTRTGGGGGNSPAPAVVTVVHRRSDYTTNATYAALVLQHVGTRRRYGTYFNNESDSRCTLRNDSVIADACSNTVMVASGISGVTACYDCIACSNMSGCVSLIPACDDFLSAAILECVSYEQKPKKKVDSEFMIALGIGCGCVIIFVCLCCGGRYMRRQWTQQRRTKECESMKEKRDALVPCNVHQLVELDLQGRFTKVSGIGLDVAYSFTIEPSGNFRGAVHIDSSRGLVTGKLNWNEQLPDSAQLMWVEQWITSGMDSEVCGNLKEGEKGCYDFVARCVSPSGEGQLNLSALLPSHERKLPTVERVSAAVVVGQAVEQREHAKPPAKLPDRDSPGEQEHMETIGPSAEATPPVLLALVPEDEGLIVDIPCTPPVGGGLL